MFYSALRRVGPSSSLSGDSCRPWAGMKMESELHQSQIMLLKLPLTRLNAKGHSSAFVIPPARRSQPFICLTSGVKTDWNNSTGAPNPPGNNSKSKSGKYGNFLTTTTKISKQNPTPNSSLKNYLQFHIIWKHACWGCCYCGFVTLFIWFWGHTW